MESEAGPGRRRRWRLIAGMVVAAVLLTAGLLLWSRSQPPEGFLLGLAPLDDDSAIVTFRYNDDESRSWAARIDGPSGLTWWTELPLLASPSVRSSGITTGGAVATVRVASPDAYEIVGIAVDSGEPRWRTPIPGRDENSLVLDWSTPETLVEGLTVTGGTVWFALDRESGALLWQIRGSVRGRFEAAVHGGDLVRYEGRDLGVWSLADGAERYRAESRGGGCLVADSLFIPQSDGLLRLELPALTETRLSGDLGPAIVGSRGDPQDFIPDGCAPYGELIVFWDAETATLRAFDPRAGAMAWELTLVDPSVLPNGLISIREWSGAGPGNLARSQLPRYLLLGIASSDPDDARLWVVDLEAQQVVGHTSNDSELIQYGLLRRGTRYVLWRFGELVAFDGERGELVGTFVLPGLAADIQDTHLRDDGLWVFGGQWTALDEAAWMLLDPETFARRAAGAEGSTIEPGPQALTARFTLEPAESRGWTPPTPRPAAGGPGALEGSGE